MSSYQDLFTKNNADENFSADAQFINSCKKNINEFETIIDFSNIHPQTLNEGWNPITGTAYLSGIFTFSNGVRFIDVGSSSTKLAQGICLTSVREDPHFVIVEFTQGMKKASFTVDFNGISGLLPFGFYAETENAAPIYNGTVKDDGSGSATVEYTAPEGKLIWAAGIQILTGYLDNFKISFISSSVTEDFEKNDFRGVKPGEEVLLKQSGTILKNIGNTNFDVGLYVYDLYPPVKDKVLRHNDDEYIFTLTPTSSFRTFSFDSNVAVDKMMLISFLDADGKSVKLISHNGGGHFSYTLPSDIDPVIKVKIQGYNANGFYGYLDNFSFI